jgi:hypothetical protein
LFIVSVHGGIRRGDFPLPENIETRELHDKVIKREMNYMPLLVNVKPDAAVPEFSACDCMRDPQKALEKRIAELSGTIKLKSDVAHFVESNFMEALVPSIFGAETHVAPGGLVDVKPRFPDIYETENINIDDIFRGEMENAIRHLEYIKHNAPDYLYVNPSRPMSPLDYAVVLCGGGFYADLLAEPDLSLNFMEKIADVTIKTIKYFKEVINQPLDECVTVRGLYFPGIRLIGDAVVNLSPNLIKNIMCPLYRKFEREFGSVMLHYCCTPAPSKHVAPALAEGGGINAVDNWQGYRTMFNEKDYFQETLAVCTDVSKNDILTGEIFRDNFFQLKQRPLIVSTYAESAEEGKKVYEIWQEQFL